MIHTYICIHTHTHTHTHAHAHTHTHTHTCILTETSAGLGLAVASKVITQNLTAAKRGHSLTVGHQHCLMHSTAIANT